jgi:Methyltransferase domain
MGRTLLQNFEQHKGKMSDKWSLYLQEWDRLFSPYREQPVRLLEIGVQNGGSLEIWASYFSRAVKFVGCDIDQKCALLKFKDPRVSIIVGDVNTEKCRRSIIQQSSSFDIIIDDGSHKSSDVIRTFARYFPLLNDHGIYIIEDLHTSYWTDFEGGFNNPFSSIAFIKRLVDIGNYEHWMTNVRRRQLLAQFEDKYQLKFSEVELSKIHSIELMNSLCIISKAPVEANVLGKRQVTGKIEQVTTGFGKHDEESPQDIERNPTDSGHLDVFEMMSIVEDNKITIGKMANKISTRNQKILLLGDQMKVKEQEIRELSMQLANSQEEVLSYALSTSWKMTRPFRKLAKLIRGRRLS